MTWETILSNKFVQSLLIAVIAFALARLLVFVMRRVIAKHISDDNQHFRSGTVIHVLGNTMTFIIYFLAVIQVLQVLLGISPTALLAASGVVGVALGFGAQSLVKDAITGFFILVENQFAIGEQVTIDAFTGTVVNIGLRTTRIKNEEGALLFIPNGTITKVINHSRIEKNA